MIEWYLIWDSYIYYIHPPPPSFYLHPPETSTHTHPISIRVGGGRGGGGVGWSQSTNDQISKGGLVTIYIYMYIFILLLLLILQTKTKRKTTTVGLKRKNEAFLCWKHTHYLFWGVRGGGGVGRGTQVEMTNDWVKEEDEKNPHKEEF